jgi:hypothetical protein
MGDSYNPFNPVMLSEVEASLPALKFPVWDDRRKL